MTRWREQIRVVRAWSHAQMEMGMDSASFESHVLGWGEGSSAKIKQDAITSQYQSSQLYWGVG